MKSQMNPTLHSLHTFLNVFFFGWVTLCSFGCSLMTTQETEGSKTTVTFGDDILGSLENVFATCNDPFVIQSGMSELSLAGDCEVSDGANTNEQLILVGLISQGTMSLGGEIPEDIDSTSETISGLSWPLQNCEVTFNTEVRFDSLEMTDLQARWAEDSQNVPELRIDLDFGADKVGEVEIDIVVDCPSSLSTWLVNAFTKELRNEANGVHNIYSNGRDLDLTFELDHDGEDIYAELFTEFRADNLFIDIDWTKVEQLSFLWFTVDVTDGEEIEESARKDFETAVDDILEESLGDLEETVEDILMSGIPSDETICDIDVKNGDLLIKTSSEGGYKPCLMLTKHKSSLLF